MQTASFVGVIETIFYFALFYYIFKFIMRLVLPMLLKKAVQQAEENLKRHAGSGYAGNQNTAYRNPKDIKPNKSKEVGEYVDFEEIE